MTPSSWSEVSAAGPTDCSFPFDPDASPSVPPAQPLPTAHYPGSSLTFAHSQTPRGSAFLSPQHNQTAAFTNKRPSLARRFVHRPSSLDIILSSASASASSYSTPPSFVSPKSIFRSLYWLWLHYSKDERAYSAARVSVLSRLLLETIDTSSSLTTHQNIFVSFYPRCLCTATDRSILRFPPENLELVVPDPTGPRRNNDGLLPILSLRQQSQSLIEPARRK